MTTRSFQLEKRTGSDFWCAVKCFEAHKTPCTGPSERFVLGEPVHTRTPFLGAEHNRERVFWITRIVDSDYDDSGPRVWLTYERFGGHGDFNVCPTELRKLPAMLRIALEADLP